MSITYQLILGIKSYRSAHNFIVRNRLWWFLIIPGLINVILILLVFIFAHYTGDGLSSYLTGMIALEQEWLQITLGWMIAFFIKLLIFMIYAWVYKYLVLITMSPFLALMSERVDSILTGRSFPFLPFQLVKDVLRGLAIAVRNLSIELGLTAVLIMLSWVPLLNVVCTFLIFVIQFYYYGFSMFDYSNERYKLPIRESIKFIGQHRTLATVNGGIFYGLFVVPFVGWIVAPAYAVTAATLANHKIREKSLLHEQGRKN